MILDFAGQNQLQAVHALDGARLTQKAEAVRLEFRAAKFARARIGRASSARQDFELTAPVIDFTVRQGTFWSGR